MPNDLPMTVIRPKVRKNGSLVDESERPLYRRYQSVRRAMRRGMTEPEAIAFVDTPRGVCQRCGSKDCQPRSRTCRRCKLDDCALASRKYREEKRHFVTKRCKRPDCGESFLGHRLRDYCDKHQPGKTGPRQSRKGEYKRPGRPRKSPAPAEVGSKLPANWDTPRKKPVEIAAKPEPVRRPPGVKVQFLAPVTSDWRRR